MGVFGPGFGGKHHPRGAASSRAPAVRACGVVRDGSTPSSWADRARTPRPTGRKPSNPPCTHRPMGRKPSNPPCHPSADGSETLRSGADRSACGGAVPQSRSLSRARIDLSRTYEAWSDRPKGGSPLERASSRSGDGFRASKRGSNPSADGFEDLEGGNAPTSRWVQRGALEGGAVSWSGTPVASGM